MSPVLESPTYKQEKSHLPTDISKTKIGNTNRMKKFCIIAMALLMAMTGCQKKMGNQYRECFENEDAVSLKDIIKVYDKYAIAKKKGKDFDLFAAFYGKEAEDVISGIEVISDTAFALQLPKYAKSSHPFLNHAEVYYNSHLIAFNVWSNLELWLRGVDGFELAEEKDIIDGINAISENCIRDKELRLAAKSYKDSILCLIRRYPDEWGEEEHPMVLLFDFTITITDKILNEQPNLNITIDSLDAITKELTYATKPTLRHYKKTKSNKRTKMMLHKLNKCSSFDKQCSLFLNWANSPEAENEDEWIVAVAERLMKSGKYNPCLYQIFYIWRCLYQMCYAGLSRDSYIPNGMYNDMRRECYLTCLKRIEKHPRDAFAIECALHICSRVNMNRFGYNFIGNEAMIEMYDYLPGRNEKEDEKNEEAVE